MGALPPIPGDWLHDAVPRALSKQFQTSPFQREGERQAGSSPSLLKDGTDLPGIPVQQSLGGTQGASPKSGRVGEKVTLPIHQGGTEGDQPHCCKPGR